MTDPHSIGFEKEVLFSEVLGRLNDTHEGFKAKTLKEIISQFAPDFLDDLFEDRPCKRQLKYIGHKDFEIPSINHPTHPFFEDGKIYLSRSFNGATYLIEGYERRIGSTYFQIVEG